MIQLTLPEPPSSNRYWRHVSIRGQPRTLLSKAARQYRQTVVDACVLVKPLSGPLRVTIQWKRARKAGDLDNRLKQLLDALRGVAYVDDAAIVEIHAYRSEGDGTVDIGIDVCG